MNKRTILLTEQNQEEEKLLQTVSSAEIHTSRSVAQHVARDVQDVGR